MILHIKQYGEYKLSLINDSKYLFRFEASFEMSSDTEKRSWEEPISEIIGSRKSSWTAPLSILRPFSNIQFWKRKLFIEYIPSMCEVHFSRKFPADQRKFQLPGILLRLTVQYCTVVPRERELVRRIVAPVWVGALTFSPPAFGPSDNSTRTFRSMNTKSQKRLVLVTNVPQSGPTVRPSDNSTRTFRSMETGSQKRLVLVTNVLQSKPTVRPPQNLWVSLTTRNCEGWKERN